MIDLLTIPAGSAVSVGAPSVPMSDENEAVIRDAIGCVTGVLEAHLPQVFVEEVMESPRQVLVLVLCIDCNADEVLNYADSKLKEILNDRAYLDVWPISEASAILETVRDADCKIAIPSKKQD